eukprot:COSAG06_NODE_38134_length_427_cov_0.460366_1_plen_51_part_10
MSERHLQIDRARTVAVRQFLFATPACGHVEGFFKMFILEHHIRACVVPASA